MITHFFFFSFPGYILLVLPSQLKRHHLLEIRLLVHRLAQLFILCAHFVLGSDTPVDSTLLYIIKSVCLFLPLDFLSPLSFWGADTELYTTLSPSSGLSTDWPLSLWTAQVWLGGQAEILGKDKCGLPSHPHCISHVGPMSILFPTVHNHCFHLNFSSASLDPWSSSQTIPTEFPCVQRLLPVCPMYSRSIFLKGKCNDCVPPRLSH